MSKVFLSLLIILCLSFTRQAVAQEHSFSGWLAGNLAVNISSKWSFITDVQLRSTAQFKHWTTLMIRPGVNYEIVKKLKIGVGYSPVYNRRQQGDISGMLLEHRLWQHIQFEHDLGNSILTHRLRLEQRLLKAPYIDGNKLKAGEDTYSDRLRYYFRGMVPFNGDRKFKKGTYLAYQNEVFLNLGDKSAVNGKVFDQNRAFVAIGSRIRKNFDLEGGYLYQRVAEARADKNNHILQIATYLRF